MTCCNSHRGFWMTFFSNILCTTTCVQMAGFFAIDEFHANLADFRLGPWHFSFHQPEIEDSFFPKVKPAFPKQEQALVQPLQACSCWAGNGKQASPLTSPAPLKTLPCFHMSPSHTLRDPLCHILSWLPVHSMGAQHFAMAEPVADSKL